jgi:hypothetical protein
MTVLWLAVPDDPGPQSMRAFIERNAIALLSNGMHPHDPPSDGWLGRYSLKAEIRQSGLWNVNHVRETVAPTFLAEFETTISQMSERASSRE